MFIESGWNATQKFALKIDKKFTYRKFIVATTYMIWCVRQLNDVKSSAPIGVLQDLTLQQQRILYQIKSKIRNLRISVNWSLALFNNSLQTHWIKAICNNLWRGASNCNSDKGWFRGKLGFYRQSCDKPANIWGQGRHIMGTWRNNTRYSWEKKVTFEYLQLIIWTSLFSEEEEQPSFSFMFLKDNQIRFEG